MSLSREVLAPYLSRAREDEDDAAQVLSRGGPGNPDVVRVRDSGREIVVKDFSARGPIVRRIAPWLVGREVRAYCQLADHPAVPRLHLLSYPTVPPWGIMRFAWMRILIGCLPRCARPAHPLSGPVVSS